MALSEHSGSEGVHFGGHTLLHTLDACHRQNNRTPKSPLHRQDEHIHSPPTSTMHACTREILASAGKVSNMAPKPRDVAV